MYSINDQVISINNIKGSGGIVVVLSGTVGKIILIENNKYLIEWENTNDEYTLTTKFWWANEDDIKIDKQTQNDNLSITKRLSLIEEQLTNLTKEFLALKQKLTQENVDFYNEYIKTKAFVDPNN